MRRVIGWCVPALLALGVGCQAVDKREAPVAQPGGAFAPAREDGVAPAPAAQADVSAKVADVPPAVRPIATRALKLRDAGQVDAAIAELNRGLKAHPKSPDLHHLLARCSALKAEGGDLTGPQRLEWLNRAVQSWEKALDLDPTFHKAAYNLGVITFKVAAKAEPDERAKLCAEARQYWLNTLKAKPGFVHAHYNLGVLAHSQGQWKEAESHYLATLKHAPQHTKARSNLGIARFHLAKTNAEGLKAAAAEWRKILNYDPLNVYAQFNLGRVAAESKDWLKAVVHWRVAVRATPRDGEQRFLQSRAWYCLAVVYDQYQPDPKRCLEAIRRAYGMYPTNREYRHMLRSVERRHGMK